MVGSTFTQVRWAGQRWVLKKYAGALGGTALGINNVGKKKNYFGIRECGRAAQSAHLLEVTTIRVPLRLIVAN